MTDTTTAEIPHDYVAEAYREQIEPPARRRWWQRRSKNVQPKPPTGPQRERFVFEIPVEHLGDGDAGRRMSITPFGPLATIRTIGRFINDDGAQVSIFTDDTDYYLPVGHIVYLAPSPESRGHELRLPTPFLAHHGAWIDPSLRLPDDFPATATGFTRDGRAYDVVEHAGHRYGVPRQQGMPQ